MILLDMNMQEKNGIEVAKELRSQKIETPIIYISAYIEMDAVWICSQCIPIFAKKRFGRDILFCDG